MSKNIPAPYKRRRFYTPEEVKKHNTANDCWVSFFNEVYDLTDLIQSNYSKLVDPIIKCAGEDITHWFDPYTKDVFFYKLAKTKSRRRNRSPRLLFPFRTLLASASRLSGLRMGLQI